jgi:hypothetical protein
MFDKEFQKYMDQWAAAQDKDIFKDDPQLPTPSAQKNKTSYFGLTSYNHDEPEEVNINDAEYWKKVISMSDSNFNGEIINEDDQKIVANVAKTIAQSPNPVKQHTIGKDQDLTAPSLGLTFSEQDVEELSELKKKVHALQDQLNTFESRGKNGQKFESQIETLQKKIDELSDAMTRTFPNAISPQGD